MFRANINQPIKGTKSLSRNRQSLTDKIANQYLLAIGLCLSAFTAQSAYAACTITPDNRYEFIASIELNGITLANGATIKNGDQLTLTPGYSNYPYQDDWSVWIDLNNDGDFADSNEQIFSSNSASNTSVNTTINISTTSSSTTTEMRVVLHAEAINDDSCNFSGFGDVNDFSVNIGDEDNGNGSTDEYALSQQPQGGNNEHIQAIEINGDSFNSGNNNGYANFSNEKTFAITHGDNIRLTPISSWSTNWAAWLDNNHNGQFETNEQVFTGQGLGDEIVQGTLNLDDISAGTMRMRIAMNGNGSPSPTGFRYGEIEDYTVNVETSGGGNNSEKNYGSQVKWTHDSVKVKIFRFEFNDAKLTWSVDRIHSEMNEIAEYFQAQSYGKFAVEYEVYDEILRVNDNVSAWDDKSSNDWKDYYAEALIALGESNYWNLDDDTIYLILSPQISDWGIKAGVNPGAIRVYDTGEQRSQAGGIAHEMGHAMGLHHAQGLDGQNTVFGVGDYENERIGYGNAFSLMGNNAWDFGGLNLYYKNFFTAFDIEQNTPLITQSGSYRIYALDQGSIAGNLGLRLKSGNAEVTYWLEYRTKDGANTQGVLVNTEGYFTDEDARSYYYGTSFLLDMTPNTHPDDLTDEYDDFDDFIDGALVVGQSYTDELGGKFTITPLGTGGTLGTPNAWIEVQVTINN